MTTPRQYDPPQHDSTQDYAAHDPNLIPADQVRQPTEDFGDPARQQDPAQQHQVDPSAQQFSPPPASADPAFRSPDAAQQQSAPQTTASHQSDSGDALFAEQELSELRTRWNDVQAGFVDDPRKCVQEADGLVSSAVEQLTASFSQTRSRLEEQWSRGEEASTEDLRLALKRYRDFFERLLAV